MRRHSDDVAPVAEWLASGAVVAESLGDSAIGAEHLLVAVLRSTDDSARSALVPFRVDDRAARAALERVHDRHLLMDVGMTGAVAADGGSPDALSADDARPQPRLMAGESARRVLARSLEIARARKRRAVASVDLLFAIAELYSGIAAEVLDDLRVDRGRLLGWSE